MTDKEARETLKKLLIFKHITEYQIRWLSTSYETPSLSFQVITQQFHDISTEQAVALLNEWLKYESSLNISVYDKARFNADSNVETILKMQELCKKLDNNIKYFASIISEGSKISNVENDQKFSVEKTDNEVTITFFNKSWFRRDNVISLSIEDAKELKAELESKLAE